MKQKGTDLAPSVTDDLYSQVRGVIAEARRYVHAAANTAMVKAYWLVGKMIVDRQGGEGRAAYGDKLISSLSARLTVEFGSGFTISNHYHPIENAG